MPLSGNIESELFKLILSAGIVAKIVLLILFLFSIFSWAIIFYKFFQIRRTEKNVADFLGIFSKIDSIHQIDPSINEKGDNPLMNIFKEGRTKFEEINRGKEGLNIIRRRLRGVIEGEVTYYEGYLPFLATTGNVTPFIGLFGTVWGIIHAFQQIGLQGTANIAAVAPGIAEALITTGIGLATAIPAVIGYNYLLSRVRKLTTRMDIFADEMLSMLEAEGISTEQKPEVKSKK
ncbi:MAG: MotA/TolQ/ExbB proton channel family protein [Nitrospirae bacterium]|nr:MotA/TolQ/ExbB proton channel family protein [Nitrospirota bacterium]